MKLYIFVFIILMPLLLKAQIDLTKATQNTKTHIFHRDTIKSIDKEVGGMIPYLILFNLTTANIPIMLSADGEKWSDFDLDPTSKHLFRCDGIQMMYIIVDSDKSNDITAKIYVRKKYKIFYYSGVKVDIVEIP
jgi:hypothetical protein